MEEFNNLVLCETRTDQIWINVRASLIYGKLTVSGHDLGTSVEDFWGDDDYEYWYNFDIGETKRLLELIGGTEHPQEALLREFSGEDGCMKMEKLCSANGIRYDFSSYVLSLIHI